MEAKTVKSNMTDMTQGSPARLILFFALPLLVGNIFQQAYTVVDTAIVGRGFKGPFQTVFSALS